MGCGMGVIKYLLFIFNFIFVVSYQREREAPLCVCRDNGAITLRRQSVPYLCPVSSDNCRRKNVQLKGYLGYRVKVKNRLRQRPFISVSLVPESPFKFDKSHALGPTEEFFASLFVIRLRELPGLLLAL